MSKKVPLEQNTYVLCKLFKILNPESLLTVNVVENSLINENKMAEGDKMADENKIADKNKMVDENNIADENKMAEENKMADGDKMAESERIETAKHDNELSEAAEPVLEDLPPVEAVDDCSKDSENNEKGKTNISSDRFIFHVKSCAFSHK